MDLGLSGRAVVVTGASRGIGRAIALGFAGEGAGVAICARRAGPLRETEAAVRARGVPAFAATCDVAAGAAIVRFLNDARAALGQIDVLVNCAGAMVEDDDDAAWERAFAVDLMGTVRASRHVAPMMAEAGGGTIVHISSISGMVADRPAAYAAMKAAVVNHGRALAEELAPAGIRVNVVAPGSIEFPGGAWDIRRTDDPELYAEVRAGIPFGRFGTPEEVAAAVLFLASSKASWISGVVLRVDGGQVKSDR